MRQSSRGLILGGLVLLAAIALRVSDPEPVAQLRLMAFDAFQRASPRVPDPAKAVTIVDIDEASLERFGQWPWPRSRLAEIVDRIKDAGARTLALDIILSEPDRLSPDALAKAFASNPDLSAIAKEAAARPANDERLAAALKGLPTVLGVSGEASRTETPPAPRAGFATAGDDPRIFTPRFSGATSPLPILAENAAALGSVNWLPASDQVVRRVPLLVGIKDTLYPALALEQFRLATGATTVLVRSSGASSIQSFGRPVGIDSLAVGETLVPVGGDGQLWLHFAPLDKTRYIPAHKLIDGTADKALLSGRDVMIGASATGLLDLRATPLDASVPGVEIHAQALEHLLSGTGLQRPTWALGAELAFLVVSGALVGALIRRWGPAIAAVAGLAAIAAIGYGAWHAFGNGLLVDPVFPSLTILAVYLTGSLAKFIATEADRNRIRYAFGHYLAPALVEELARDPSKLKLGGELREVSVLFTDVRGFSKLSEGMDAEELLGFVNSLFTPFSEVILNHRGTIDKFMGDGIMAFWNAPADDPEHAANACRAALALNQRLSSINDARRTRLGARGDEYVPIRIGIGINSGACSAGNVGSPQSLNYSIMGEAVNVAARLEEATKNYGLSIIVGENTVLTAGPLAFLDIGHVTPRGKTRPERIFALLGDEATAQSQRFLDLQREHRSLMEATARRDMPAALDRLAVCRTLNWSELKPLFDTYERALTRA